MCDKTTTADFRRMFRTACRLLALVMISGMLLSGCSDSDDDDDGDNGPDKPTPVTVVPESVDAMASAEAAGVRQDIDISTKTQNPGFTTMKIIGMSTDADQPVLILHYFTRDASGSIQRFVEYDLTTASFTTLKDGVDTSSSADISCDGTALTWLDGSSCTLWYQTLEPQTDPQRINELLQDTSCPRPPALSAHGDIVLFDQAVGRYDINGVLVFDRFDRDIHDLAIVRPDTRQVIELSVNDRPVGDGYLDSLSRVLVYEGSSHDGRRIAFKAFFLPRTLPDAGLPDYVVGTLLVNTLTGDLSLLNRNRYKRFFSQRVPAGVQDDATLSGNGDVAWYVESDGINVPSRSAVMAVQHCFKPSPCEPESMNRRTSWN